MDYLLAVAIDSKARQLVEAAAGIERWNIDADGPYVTIGGARRRKPVWWAPDPFGVGQARFYDGCNWTDLARDGHEDLRGSWRWDHARRVYLADTKPVKLGHYVDAPRPVKGTHGYDHLGPFVRVGRHRVRCPGWFRDPDGRKRQQRWFDGKQWTDHTRRYTFWLGRPYRNDPHRGRVYLTGNYDAPPDGSGSQG